MSKPIAANSPVGIVAYAIVGLAIAFELVVVWLALHPQVPDDYRAYYLDLSTTCLNQPVSGDYALGTIVSFLPDGADAAKPLKVCGWEGPAGDGTHAVGTSSRLRFALPPDTGALRLTLDLFAIEREDHPSQRIAVEVNGELLTTETVAAGDTARFDVTIPAALVASHPHALEVILNFPDAVRMGPNVATTYSRSIKLLAAGVMAEQG